jgi:hypothetical protein
VILVLALAFTLACVGASALRLSYVIEATPFDPASLVAGLRGGGAMLGPDALGVFDAAAERTPGAGWERNVAMAMVQSQDLRPATLGESMTELDFLTRRWASVPRVCASLASSFGFLLATVALRVGLSRLAGTLDPDEVVSVNAAVLDAIDAAAIGLVGTAFCIAIQHRARAAVAARLLGAERFVELLEGLESGDSGPLAQAGARASVGSLHSTVT